MKKLFVLTTLFLCSLFFLAVQAQQKIAPPPFFFLELTDAQIEGIHKGLTQINLTQPQGDLLAKITKSYLGKSVQYNVVSVQGPDVIAKDRKVKFVLNGIDWVSNEKWVISGRLK